jgi:hypothetical protein
MILTKIAMVAILTGVLGGADAGMVADGKLSDGQSFQLYDEHPDKCPSGMLRATKEKVEGCWKFITEDQILTFWPDGKMEIYTLRTHQPSKTEKTI